MNQFATLRREFGLGFLYWLAFVVVLEPGNIARALQGGTTVPVGQEAFRLVGAGLLGAMATPAVFALTRRFAIEGPLRWRHAAIHMAADAVLAVTLTASGCVLAFLFLAEERRPLLTALREQIAVDGLLLFFCLAVLTAIAHATLFFGRIQVKPDSGYLSTVPVKTRGRTVLVDLADVDWIETQGNYLALHAGSAVHLIRDTSVHFEAALDPARFTRIHRQTLVALDRIRAITALLGGDATLHLADGTELRVSRNFREVVKSRFEARR